MNRIVSKAGLRAGIQNPNPSLKNINPHLLRHSFSGNAKKGGLRIDVLSLILGHSSTKTTMDMYGTPNIDDIQEEYEKKVGLIFS
ncbi:MAG: site-specific integrase [Deltaproteobacteria bacterium]|nr:site-specific integrase [Deltaproteobacteria bacterium]